MSIADLIIPLSALPSIIVTIILLICQHSNAWSIMKTRAACSDTDTMVTTDQPPQWAHVAKHSSDNEEHADQYGEYFMTHDTTFIPKCTILNVRFISVFSSSKSSKVSTQENYLLTVSSLFFPLT